MKKYACGFGSVVLAFVSAASGCAHSQSSEKKSLASQRATPPPPPPSPPNDRRNLPDGMKVQGEMGTLEPAQIEDAFKKQANAVQGCYDRGLRKYPNLGGAMELKVRVDKTGKVMFAGITQALGSVEVERCLLDLTRAIAFPTPKGGEAEFTYPFTFRGKVTVQEWGNAEVGELFARNRVALDTCAKKGVDGGVPPSMRVTFFVIPGGTVPSAGVGADKPMDDAYAQCIADEVARWKFADPRGRIARATYQF